MSQTTTPKQVPLDILQVDSFLRDFRTDLTDVMMMAVDEWSAALRDDLRSWQKSDGPEPGWQSFRDWTNEVFLACDVLVRACFLREKTESHGLIQSMVLASLSSQRSSACSLREPIQFGRSRVADQLSVCLPNLKSAPVPSGLVERPIRLFIDIFGDVDQI